MLKMLGYALSVGVLGLVTACGSPSPAPPITVTPAGSSSSAPIATGGGNAKPPPSTGSRRTPSDVVAKAFPFQSAPKLVAYADFDGFFKTELLKSLVTVVLDLSKGTATEPQIQCMKDFVASAKEMAGGDDDSGMAGMVVRFDPATAKPGKCIQTLKDVKTEKVAGADEAYSLGSSGVAAVKSNLFIAGTRSFVEAATAGGGGAALSDMSLGPDEYLVWNVALERENMRAKGSIVASNEHFRIDADIDMPREEIAADIEKQMSLAKLAPSLMAREAGMKNESLDALKRLIEAVTVKRNGKRILAAFDLKEPPADQARDLGAAATLAVYSVRSYISNAKTAEAKNALDQIARDIVTDFEKEDIKATPRSRKKLASFPAVPKAVPKGMKYQSKTDDWKPWRALMFEMTAPQYFQYEVKAAKDGESCEIIAHGDLNGDGKQSTFKLTVKIDRKGDRVVIGPKIEETDPQE